MDLSSTLSGTKEFRIVKRGYDPDEVDTFLDQIAVGVAELKRKLAESGDRTKGGADGESAPTGQADEVHRVLVMAQRTADEEVRRATEEGQRLVSEAQAQADAVRTEVEQALAGRREEGERLVADARAEADAARAQVDQELAGRREEGQRLLDEAKANVAALQAEIDRDLATRRREGRAALAAEIAELEAVRDAFGNDVAVLERHVEEQREVVQAAIGELQTLLDHPEAFRVAAPSGVSETSAPPPEPVVDDAPAGGGTTTSDAPASPVGDAAADGAPAAGTMVEVEIEVEASPAPVDEPKPPTPAKPATPAKPTKPARQAKAVKVVKEVQEAPAPTEVVADGTDAADGPGTEALRPAAAAKAPSPVDPDEDAFLAELRKAMLDDEPLGPRDTSGASSSDELSEESSPGGRPRFGRRR